MSTTKHKRPILECKRESFHIHRKRAIKDGHETKPLENSETKLLTYLKSDDLVCVRWCRLYAAIYRCIITGSERIIELPEKCYWQGSFEVKFGIQMTYVVVTIKN